MRVRGSAIIQQDDKILTLVYNYPEGRVHAIPGGNLDDGEILDQCIVREYQEELGLEIAIDRLLYVGDMPGSEHIKPAIHVIFQAHIVSGVPQLNPVETSAAEYLWLPLDQLEDILLYPAINQAILDDLNRDPNPRYLGNCMTRKWA